MRRLVLLILGLNLLVGSAWLSHAADSPAPAVRVEAGPSGPAISTESARPWKRWHVMPGPTAGTWTWIQAEHGQGDDGGLWLYTITVAPSATPSPLPPVPPGPHELPLAELRAIVAAQATGRSTAETAKLATLHEALAGQIDAGQIVNPTQLALATQVQYLAVFTTDQLAAWKPWRAAVGAWIDAQQSAKRLSGETMPRYADVYRAIAESLRSIRR